MIVTINEQHKHFVSEMRKCGLLHETDLNLPFLDLRLVSMTIVNLSIP